MDAFLQQKQIWNESFIVRHRNDNWSTWYHARQHCIRVLRLIYNTNLDWKFSTGHIKFNEQTKSNRSFIWSNVSTEQSAELRSKYKQNLLVPTGMKANQRVLISRSSEIYQNLDTCISIEMSRECGLGFAYLLKHTSWANNVRHNDICTVQNQFFHLKITEKILPWMQRERKDFLYVLKNATDSNVETKSVGTSRYFQLCTQIHHVVFHLFQISFVCIWCFLSCTTALRSGRITLAKLDSAG